MNGAALHLASGVIWRVIALPCPKAGNALCSLSCCFSFFFPYPLSRLLFRFLQTDFFSVRLPFPLPLIRSLPLQVPQSLRGFIPQRAPLPL